MKTFLVLLAVAASVYADGGDHHLHHHHHAPTDTGASNGPSPTSSYVEPASEDPSGPSAPSSSSSYGAPQPTTGVDQQGYYYYYYPVQEQKTKGLFDFKKDNDLLFAVIISLIIVGALLLTLSFLGSTIAGRTFDPIHVSYDDMYYMAKKVYQAISKKY